MENDNNASGWQVLLLTTSRSYRNPDFLSAAEKLNIRVIQGIDAPRDLFTDWDNGLALEFHQRSDSVQHIVDFSSTHPIDAILAVDDSGTELAAEASERLGLKHNSLKAASAARNKFVMRQQLQRHGVQSPHSQIFSTQDDPQKIIHKIDFPCVVKPLNLNGSRGVIRADNSQQLTAAIKRTTNLITSLNGNSGPQNFIIETYVPGFEVALEGLVDNGQLIVLAIFDKPDPLIGPYFEETIYVTPSRLPDDVQAAIIQKTIQAAAALGLRTGPIHAELRINESGPWIIEVAGRSIGGLCSRILQFGMETSLEELILRQACNLDFDVEKNFGGARGVMMIPIPGPGLLRVISGIEEAESVNLIEGVEITAHLDNPLVPLPEGDGYLGFIFSKGPDPESVENALRAAHQCLQFTIDPLLPMLPT